MSSSTSYSGGILTTSFDYAKLFIWNNRYDTATYTAGADGTLAAGTVIGRIFSSGKIAPMDSTATDGSQYPIGVLKETTAVTNGTSYALTYCKGGDVDASLLVFAHSGDTLATVIQLSDDAGTPNHTKMGTVKDILSAAGVNAITTSQNTLADN